MHKNEDVYAFLYLTSEYLSKHNDVNVAFDVAGSAHTKNFVLTFFYENTLYTKQITISIINNKYYR